MFLPQKTSDPKTNIPTLRPLPTDARETTDTASEPEMERHLAQAAIEDYLDRVCVPFVETLPYAARVEMRREIASHLKALVLAYEELGDPPATATQKALGKFGSPEQVARLWRESSAMYSVGTQTKTKRFTRQVQKHWPGVSVTLSALFLLAGWLAPLHPVTTPPQNVGTTTAVTVRQTGSNLAAAGLSIAGFKHLEAVQNKNCVDCHRAPAGQTLLVDQRFLVEQTKQWMDAKALKEKAAIVKP